MYDDAAREIALWEKYGAELELLESLLGPVGAITRYIRTRVARTVTEASDIAGVSVTALVERVESDEAFGDLLLRAPNAGRRTRHEKKRRAFARAIADGYLAKDDAAVDFEAMMVGRIDRLEMPHIRALEKISVAAGPDGDYQDLDRLLEPWGREEAELIVGDLDSIGLVNASTSQLDEEESGLRSGLLAGTDPTAGRRRTNLLGRLSPVGALLLGYLVGNSSV